jgi:adenylate cyclase
MDQRRFEDARRHHDRAFALNPNDPRLVAQKGELFTWLGKPEEGAELVRAAMRLDPYETHARAHLLGRALYAQGKYREAAEAYAANSEPRWGHRAELAAALAQAGEAEAATSQAADVVRENPKFSAAAYGARLAFAREEDRARLIDGLIKAGLPN